MVKKIQASLKNPSHPVWALLRMTIIASFLLFFLYLNSTKFDKTEITTILQVLLGLLGLETIQNRVQHTLSQSQPKSKK